MANTFPTTKNSFITGASSGLLGTVGHASAHNAYEDAIGTTSSTDSTSLRFKTSEITGGDTGVGKSATQTLTNKTLTSPIINTPTITSPTGITKSDVGLGNVTNNAQYYAGGTDVAITDGGTGASTLPAGLLIGAGTSAITAVTAPSGTVVGTTDTQTLTNKRIDPRVVSATSYTTDTGTSLSVATCDLFVVTAQAGALKFNNPGGTPVQGQKLMIRIKDDGTARALTYDTQFNASTDLALPSTTVLSKELYMGFIFNSTSTKWTLLAVLNNI